jgi:ABC-type multidrug transport system fused ATPase/permease subunit
VKVRSYPRIYGSSLVSRLFWAVLSAACIGISLFVIVNAVIDDSKGPVAATLIIYFFLLFGFAGVFMILSVFRTKIVLTANAIEIHGPFRKRLFAKNEIRCYRFQSNRKGVQILAIMTHANESVCVPLFFDRDHAFDAWFRKLKNADLEGIPGVISRDGTPAARHPEDRLKMKSG